MGTTAPSDGLVSLEPGMIIPFGGDRFTCVPADLAAAFRPGDALIVCQSDGELLHITADVRSLVAEAVGAAVAASIKIRTASVQGSLVQFFAAFAHLLKSDGVWDAIEIANRRDVRRASLHGRDISQLEIRSSSREDMIEGLLAWAGSSEAASRPTTIDHGSWRVERLNAPVGVVGFVFEGRPNVLVDACGVVASGNAAVLRIGEDAAGTAEAIAIHALRPALKEARLPNKLISILPPLGREGAWALFTDRRLSLAVARGSGPAVRLLGDLATQSGIPVSLHGVGGAWLLADEAASVDRFRSVVEASLDRKVCNTLNTCLIVRSRSAELIPAFVNALRSAAARGGHEGRLHVLEGSEGHVPRDYFDREVVVARASGPSIESFASPIPLRDLGREWEWEGTPEVTLAIVDDRAAGVDLINRYSPRFVASLISEDAASQRDFFEQVDAPFVGDGFTRWVDGQYALNEPELGLANWEFGRPLGRASVLTGASVHTVRLRMLQTDPDLRRE